MKNIVAFFISIPLILASGCTNGQNTSQKTVLSPKEYSEKINQLSNEIIIDVRTAEEYAAGHLINSKNINWNGGNFDTQISTLDKSTPVFVYCAAGGRSSSAAKKMRSVGFKEVYDLSGGIIDWRKAKLPETKN